MNVMDVTRRLYAIADRARRWREAVDVSATLTISPTRARQLLDRGMTPDEVREHVWRCNAEGVEP